jgi:2-iminobutanoate/2-iminopropanoate deaminase
MTRRAVSSDRAPDALGPYSQAIVAGGFVFCSGMAGIDPTIFYADVEDFSRLNEVYARHMPDPPPARSAPAHVRLPRGLLVSIEAIAVLPAVSP